jgi:hypothetical protein
VGTLFWEDLDPRALLRAKIYVIFIKKKFMIFDEYHKGRKKEKKVGFLLFEMPTFYG